ncbi:TetR/AcrR family transcriptional regulator [Roseobacter sp. OBYS 0001]|uniref:TetR/AcrR family transcriptional regulator n=1 Tax=Roseobacter sp. OBYS 0001 TaxID=882651 RepID=UPI001BBDCED5|nr:TetR/AcrR family transcriptional regulator [Roseobacter sp. OBYS 0001]GIT89478.1 hypothetical protein ROBYS_44940 [Roseobacter sp. OBYS 0001]
MTLGRPRKFDDDALLDRAVDLVWREGPLALSLNEIAKLLETTKPALARRFGGKDQFLVAVLKRYHERLDTLVQDAIGGATNIHDVASAYLRTYQDVLSKKPVGPATGCLLAAATEASANQSETVLAETIRTLNDRTRTGLLEALRRVGADDTDRLARYLYGQSVALAFLSRIGTESAELGDYVERALAGV